MKIIVISGASSKVGKTSLALALCDLFPDALYIKIGHGKMKPEKKGVFYHTGTSFEDIKKNHPHVALFIIESNSILRHITPHCVIYLAGENPKPSALTAQTMADITRGEPVSDEKIRMLSQRLAFSDTVVRQIARHAGALLGQ